MNSNDFQPKITMLYFKVENTLNFLNEIGSCGQSYKHFTLVNYEPRVVIWSNFQSGTTLES